VKTKNVGNFHIFGWMDPPKECDSKLPHQEVTTENNPYCYDGKIFFFNTYLLLKPNHLI
jgi:hypothetical protein